MTGDAVGRLREDHRPGKIGGSGTPPKLSVDEISDAARHETERHERRHEVRDREERLFLSPGKKNHHEDDAEKAAVRAHAAVPERKDFARMRKVVARLIKEAVAEPSAQHHAEDPVKEQILHVLGRDPAPGFLGAQASQAPESGEAQKIHYAVPTHGKRTERKNDGVELRMNKHVGLAVTNRRKHSSQRKRPTLFGTATISFSSYESPPETPRDLFAP